MGNIHVEVLSNDIRLKESLTQDFRQALLNNAGIIRSGLTVEGTSESLSRPAANGASNVEKGTAEYLLALLVAGAPFARPTADVLIAAIQEWCARDERRRVSISKNGETLTIVGNPTTGQTELIEEFIQRHEDDGDETS